MWLLVLAHDSLPNVEVPEHFHILSVCLFIVDLIVVSLLSMNQIEVTHVCCDDSRESYGPTALNQAVSVSASIYVCCRNHDGRNSSNQGLEASFSLHNAEALVIIEEFWFLINLGSFLLAQDLPNLLLSLQENIDLIKSTRVLATEHVRNITRFVIFIRHWPPRHIIYI